MNKKIIFIIFILLFLSGCELIEVIKYEYKDWDSLMKASENQKGWFPPLFDGSLPFNNKIKDITILFNLDTNRIWGKFAYTDDFIDNLPIQVKEYNIKYNMLDRDNKRIKKIGYNENKINYYFTEENTNEKSYDYEWYYFVNNYEKYIYFCNFYLIQITTE